MTPGTTAATGSSDPRRRTWPSSSARQRRRRSASDYDDSISVASVTLGNNDTLEISDSATLSTTGNFTNSGILQLDTGGQLQVGGTETETAAATIDEQIDGPPASNYFGVLAVTGQTMLGGTFNLALLDEFTPVVGQNFPVITFGSVSGNFATVTGTEWGGGLRLQRNTSSHQSQPDRPADTPLVHRRHAAHRWRGLPVFVSVPGQRHRTPDVHGHGAAGLGRLSTSGLLTGTPPTVGTFNFTVIASNGVEPDATQNITLLVQVEPLVFTADAPPVAIGGSSISYQFQANVPGPSPTRPRGCPAGPRSTRPPAYSRGRRRRTGRITSL